MSRISICMQRIAERGGKAVVPYLVAGDPAPQATVALMHQLAEDGADIIELGIPFSDPMAEGPVIQKAHERALEHNVSLRSVLAMVAEFRQKNTETPVVLMGYANPIVAMGYAVFADAAHGSGVDGVLTVDLPPEESAELTAELKRHDIDAIFLVAPTTTDLRIQSICDAASGYIYYVSLKGVTGAGHLDIADVEKNIARIRQHTNLPVCVGFGIKDADSAQAVASCADGVVVGSALVNELAEFETTGSSDIDIKQIKRVLHDRFRPIAAAASDR